MRHLLRIADLEAGELLDLLDLSVRFKSDPSAYASCAAGKVVGIVFEKPSLRTRFSVESALARIGAHPIGAYDREVGLGAREPLGDAARVLSGYVDAIVLRTSAHDRVEDLAGASSVPVVNALSDDHHPLQALADLLTIAESHADNDPNGLKGLRVAYVGDGNNVAHSLIEAGALCGMEVALACPAGHEPDAGVVEWARDRGGSIEVTSDPAAAARGACAVYTDVWTSMGFEAESESRRRAFTAYSVTPELMAAAGPGAVFLHCLPAHRGEEVAASVIDGPASRVFEQAANRMPTAAAVLLRAWEL